jgi:4,4'-diaponeurosporenoate glycosyltransferase
MMVTTLLCALGVPAAFVLIRRVPTCPPAQPHTETHFSIVIPARNEEQNLPRLLASIADSATRPAEVLVIDDASTDNTAPVGVSFGAQVLMSAPLPPGWTGKSWACHQGAQRAIGDLLLFLDADTYFVSGGLDRLIACWLRERDRCFVISLLPYHETTDAYEQLSLIFNLLMAAGAGGFGAAAAPRLFGQSLLIAKETYLAAGGHSAVRGIVLENLRFAAMLRDTGARIRCFGGRGTLHMRMFPEGFRQMSESWAKAFNQGAADSGVPVLASAIVWISALWSTTLLLAAPCSYDRPILAALYLLLGLHLAWIARQLGSYRLLTSLLYPLPLAYYCFVFGWSAARHALRRKTLWRGREV